MIYETSNQQPNVNVFPNGNGGNYGGDGFGNNGAWWIIILFLFAMMGGWGNNGNNAGGPAYIPYAVGGMGGQNYVQQGFDQAAIMGGINGIQTASILTDNLAQTQALEQYLAPVPRPAYLVQNPNCCGTSSMFSTCGCSR